RYTESLGVNLCRSAEPLVGCVAAWLKVYWIELALFGTCSAVESRTLVLSYHPRLATFASSNPSWNRIVPVGGGVGTPAWLAVNVWPAIVIVPLRAAPVFAATEYVTVPLPVPLLPAVIVIHDALLAAVHAHVVADAVTVTLPVVAAAAGDALDGDSENVHV